MVVISVDDSLPAPRHQASGESQIERGRCHFAATVVRIDLKVPLPLPRQLAALGGYYKGEASLARPTEMLESCVWVSSFDSPCDPVASAFREGGRHSFPNRVVWIRLRPLTPPWWLCR
jgi:hypothetical protein